MPSTPAETVSVHMAAINRRDHDAIAATSSFPLIQMWPDGSKTIMATPNDMIPTGEGLAPEWSRTDIDQLDLIDTTGNLVVYRLTFTRFDTNGKPTLGTHQGLWAVCRDGEGWKVAWRQYLGPV